jgi:hypothetical protein
MTQAISHDSSNARVSHIKQIHAELIRFNQEKQDELVRLVQGKAMAAACAVGIEARTPRKLLAKALREDKLGKTRRGVRRSTICFTTGKKRRSMLLEPAT